MERILVSMSARHGAWGAWSRAISLAKRIEARVYALLVMPQAAKDVIGRHADSEAALAIRRRLELLIETAKLDGVRIDFFVSEGSYEEEVIRFVEDNKITMLVVEQREVEMRHSDRDFSHIRKIRHRIRCRVELVTPRKNQELERKEG
jgi:nucleotide-binding universal stress UspA family protein